MVKSASLSPPYSVIIISNQDGNEVPMIARGTVFGANRNCISVGCRSEMDGIAEIIIGGTNEVCLTRPPDFCSHLETIHHTVAVETVFGDRFLEYPTPYPNTKVSIWINDDMEPDKIIIGISS